MNNSKTIILLCIYLFVIILIGCTDNTPIPTPTQKKSILSGKIVTLSKNYTDNFITVSHVMSISMSSFNRVIAEVEADGTFSLVLESYEDALSILFIDDSKTGIDMLVGALNSDKMNSIILMNNAADNITMGDIDIANLQAIPSALSITALGLTVEEAVLWGNIDDYSKRYYNPDVDANGEIDMLQPDNNFGFEFYLEFNLKLGSADAALSDIKNTYLPDTITVTNTNSIISCLIPITYIPSLDYNSATLAIDAPVGGISEYNFSCYSWSSNGSHNGYYFDISESPPIGNYTFTIYNKNFNFYYIDIPDFTSSTNFLMPFLKLNIDQNDYLTGIEWIWKKKTEIGWITASQEEILLIVKELGYFYFWGDKTIIFDITSEVSDSQSYADAIISHPYDAPSQPVKLEDFYMYYVTYNDRLGISYNWHYQ